MTIPTGHLTPANTWAIGLPTRVFVDGVEVKSCVEAHTEEGWAAFYEPVKGANPPASRRRTLTGTVTVKLVEASA